MARRTPRASMRIAVVAPPCLPVPPPAYGGTELVVAELVDGLLDRGHQVVLFGAPGSTGGYRRRCQVVTPLSQAVWPPSDEAEREHCRLAFAAIAADRPGFDAVHLHCPTGVEFARHVPAQVVCTLHHPREPRYSALYQAHPEVCFAAISARQLALEAPLARTSVVHHGLDPARYPLGPGGPAAAFLGRLSEVKGPHRAIDVARAAGVALRVAGKPHAPDAAYFEREVRHRLAQPGVEYLGELGHEPKCALLAGALALLVPIVWEEPFGLVLVEAMLCGCPPIAFPRGAAPELIDEGLTGFLVEGEREMAEVLRRLARRPFDRAACRARAVTRFGMQAMTRRYEALFAGAARAGAEARGVHG